MESNKITTISFILRLSCFKGQFDSQCYEHFLMLSLAVKILLDENENIHYYYLINGKDLSCCFVTKFE